MGIAPAFRVTTVRSHLIGSRGHRPAETLSEFALDVVLARLAEALRPGAKAPTKASLAELLEDAERTAREQAQAAICSCGHAFAEHVGSGGCFECRCTARRPHATEAPPAPSAPVRGPGPDAVGGMLPRRPKGVGGGWPS